MAHSQVLLECKKRLVCFNPQNLQSSSSPLLAGEEIEDADAMEVDEAGPSSAPSQPSNGMPHAPPSCCLNAPPVCALCQLSSGSLVCGQVADAPAASYGCCPCCQLWLLPTSMNHSSTPLCCLATPPPHRPLKPPPRNPRTSTCCPAAAARFDFTRLSREDTKTEGERERARREQEYRESIEDTAQQLSRLAPNLKVRLGTEGREGLGKGGCVWRGGAVQAEALGRAGQSSGGSAGALWQWSWLVCLGMAAVVGVAGVQMPAAAASLSPFCQRPLLYAALC